jgi:hypothetical protein|tara:strand:+ start:161 stop:511 length:351 start_codon:yes stop_codon:yes gene_type:complete
MTLQVDLTKVENFKTLCYEKKGTKDPDNKFLGLPYTRTTNYLVMASMAIGVGEITTKNYKEVFARHQFLQEGQVTLDDVKNHIGLKTNVAPETIGRWLMRIAKSKFNDTMHNIRYK